MLNHPVDDEKLVAYFLGELDRDEAHAVSAHLLNCDACATTLEHYQAVREILAEETTQSAPPAVIKRAESIFFNERSPVPRWSFPSFNLKFVGSMFAVATVAVMVVLCTALMVLSQDAPPDSALYPVKMQVEGLQHKFTDTLSKFGIAAKTPTATSTPKPNPSVTPPAQPGNVPPDQTKTPPGQVNTPPGQAKTPPGQVNTPPGQAKTPPGQVNTPPGQAKTPPGQVNTPPGQAKTPPGQVNTPPGQINTPPGQIKTPPGQINTPPGQNNPPPGQNDTPPGQDKNPPEKPTKKP